MSQRINTDSTPEIVDEGLARMKHCPTYYSFYFAGWYYLYRKVEYRDSKGRKRVRKTAFIDADSHSMIASKTSDTIEKTAASLNKAAICFFSQRAHESKKIRELRLHHDGRLPLYAWPGGYPIFYVDSHNSVICPTCANNDSSLQLVDYDANYEDGMLYCEKCSTQIEAAYLADEESDEY